MHAPLRAGLAARAAAACVLASVLGSTGACAPTSPANTGANAPKKRLNWKESWRPFQLGDYLWTAAVLGGYLSLEMRPAAVAPKWRGPILFDEKAQQALAADTRDERLRWAKTSDWGWRINGVSAWATPLIVPLFDDFDWRLSWQLVMMNAQSYGFAGLVTRSGHVFVGRERPNTEVCNATHGGSPSVLCFGGENASFPSGHASGAFTGAGLSCVHHLELGLFGHVAADATWCAALLGLATFTGLGRNVADFHYMSDTILGAALGLASGVGGPLLFHYGLGDGDATPPGRAAWTLVPLDTGFGLSLVGTM